MAIIRVCASTQREKLARLVAGDRVLFERDSYREPVLLSGIRGTRNKPVIFESGDEKQKNWARFTSDISSSDYKTLANEIAKKRQLAGYFPSVGQTADEAMLVLHNCQYVVIRNLKFHGCWPGAIYVDQCQEIVIDNVDFEQGTIAIGLNGHDTRNIVVQNCRWQQDTGKKRRMWESIPWVRIHGASDNQKDSSVDIARDSRLYDGDFVRGWDVAGNITIRNNTIRDAFNGVHFFNSLDRLAPGVNPNAFKFNSGRRSSANILIEGNDFIRVLDNCVEPESHAWNWVVRHNRMMDCYRPFSLELDRAGWFYIYGNTGAFLNDPSSDTEDSKVEEKDLRRRMSLFKVKGKQQNEGGIYVFFNSWYYANGKGLFPKGKLGGLLHCNNAAGFARKHEHWTFGNDGLMPTEQPYDIEREKKAESQRFTRRWNELSIRFDGDIIQDAAFPEKFRLLGYKIGKNARGADPCFKSVSKKTKFENLNFKPAKNSPLSGNAIEMNIFLPSGKKINAEVLAGCNVGQHQKHGFYDEFDPSFDFVFDNDWIRGFPNQAALLRDQ